MYTSRARQGDPWNKTSWRQADPILLPVFSVILLDQVHDTGGGQACDTAGCWTRGRLAGGARSCNWEICSSWSSPYKCTLAQVSSRKSISPPGRWTLVQVSSLYFCIKSILWFCSSATALSATATSFPTKIVSFCQCLSWIKIVWCCIRLAFFWPVSEVECAEALILNPATKVSPEVHRCILLQK